MDAREISIAFAKAFCAPDLVRLESLLAPELRLRGPLFTFDSRDDYLRALHEDPSEPGDCEILRVHGETRGAAILYEYRKPDSSVLVAQFNEVSAGLISDVTLVFDTAKVRRSE